MAHGPLRSRPHAWRERQSSPRYPRFLRDTSLADAMGCKSDPGKVVAGAWKRVLREVAATPNTKRWPTT